MKPHPSPSHTPKARLGGTLLLSCFMQRAYPHPLGFCYPPPPPPPKFEHLRWGSFPAAAIASGGMADCDRPWFSQKFTEQCSVGAY